MGFFKSQIKAFEESNNGLRINCNSAWDVAVLKGRKVGAVFGNQEFYNANTGQSYWYTGLDHLISVDDVINGNFKVPKDKEDRKKPKASDMPSQFQATTSDIKSDFEEILDDAEVPF